MYVHAEKAQILETSTLLDLKRVAASVGKSFSSPHAFSQRQAYRHRPRHWESPSDEPLTDVES